MLSHLIEDWARRIARHAGAVVAKTKITPNGVTIIGFLLNFPVVLILGQGGFFWGGFLILFAGAFDMLDGAVARVTGKTSKFGAFLDSTFDRFSEIVVLLGLLFYYRSPLGIEGEKMNGSILVYVAVTGSLMVSYVKARAEGLGLVMKGVGLLPRPERVVLLALACFLSAFFGEVYLIIALWILAVGTNFTAFQRIAFVWFSTHKEAKLAEKTAQAAARADNPQLLDTNRAKDKSREEETAETVAHKRWSFRRAGR